MLGLSTGLVQCEKFSKEPGVRTPRNLRNFVKVCETVNDVVAFPLNWFRFLVENWEPGWASRSNTVNLKVRSFQKAHTDNHTMQIPYALY